MKIYLLLILLLIGSQSLTASSTKKHTADIDENSTEVFILDKGIKRKIIIPKNTATKQRTPGYKAEQINAKSGVIIRFKNSSKSSIQAFELKYQLKLKTKLLKNYYLFENISKYSDIEIINQIMQNETNIQTLRPNWKLHNTPR